MRINIKKIIGIIILVIIFGSMITVSIIAFGWEIALISWSTALIGAGFIFLAIHLIDS